MPTSLVRRLMRVARTVTKICGDWRSKGDDCGCLIGTIYGPNLGARWKTPALCDAEYEVGMKFLARLADEVPGSRTKDGTVKVFVFSRGLLVTDE